MTDFVIPVPRATALAVAHRAERFPVGRIFCIGRNYRWSADEPFPQAMPDWFMKPATSLIPAEGVIPYPPGTRDLCHEIELVVAIGKGGQDIALDAVESEHVWGYAAGLDMTRRDLQQHAKRTGAPWEPSKAFDASAPCTPVVSAQVCGHPRIGAIWLDVNGSTRQRADLAGLLWPVPELVAMLSRSVALLPGDLIFTGTPSGVGPLQPGDVVHAGIANIGEIRMTVGQPRP